MIGQKLGHYRIIDVLGAGAFGTVYTAEDLARPRLVALRILPRELTRNESRLAEFDRGLAATAGLEHPGIVRMIERGEADAFQFMVMPLVDGQTLASRLRRGPLQLAEAIRVAREVGEVLAAAHARGIVHGDLRPDNIMVTTRGVRVLGYGLPPEILPRRSDMEALRTTYLSPERLRGAPPDAAADLYALGVMLYEMVAGRRPFAGESPQAVARAVFNERPDLPSALREGVPLSLERTMLKALAREPAGRQVDAAEWLAELAQAENDLNAIELTRKPLIRRRRRHFGTTLSTIAVILVLVLIFLIAELFRLRGGR